MFKHSYRGTLVWLFVVGMALVLVMLAEGVPTEVSAALLAAYLGLVVMVTRDAPFGAMLGNLRARVEREQEPTEVAREAAARARSYPNYDALIQLLDVGLIVDEQRPDGMALRRGRFISLDDDAIRPFATIRVPDGLAGHKPRPVRTPDGTGRFALYEDEKWPKAKMLCCRIIVFRSARKPPNWRPAGGPRWSSWMAGCWARTISIYRPPWPRDGRPWGRMASFCASASGAPTPTTSPCR
jgi:hypothetical protein